MTVGPEDIARENIDRMLELFGWAVQDAKAVNQYVKPGAAIRKTMHGERYDPHGGLVISVCHKVMENI